MPLHLTKVAYGAQSLEELHGWFAERGDEARLTTRYLPKRHAEILDDGPGSSSLFWIYKHQLVARSPILRFEEAEGGRTHIVIAPRLISVLPIPRRAHQGWRYMEAKDAPQDLGGDADGGEVLPGKLASELARLGLV
ncbi:MAG: DUF1489 domain-containing protein [Sphingomonadales bacterium]|nr:DUF1489 domain-containing protein [Sphingomonadales bacterium]